MGTFSRTTRRTRARPDPSARFETRTEDRRARQSPLSLRPFVRALPLACAALACVLIPIEPARAQSTAKENAITARDRADFEALGLDLGTLVKPFLGGYESQTLNSVTVRPRFEVVQEFNDNVFNQSDRGKADKIVHFKPGLALATDWDNHSVTMFFDADRGRYYENRQESYTDFNVGTKNAIQVLDEFTINAGYTFSKKHEVGNAPLDPATSSKGGTAFGQEINDAGFGKTDYDQHIFELGSTFSTDPLLLRVETAARRQSYISKIGQSNEDRNSWQLLVTPRVGYVFFEDTTFFIQPQYAQRFYDAKFDRSGTNNNSREYQLQFGVTYDFTDLTFAEISGGIVRSEYDDRRFKPSNGFTFDAEIIWNATELSTFFFRAGRSNLGTTDSTTKTVATQTFTLGLDYEALDNLILSASVNYTNAEYLTDIPVFVSGVRQKNRDDHQFLFQAGLRYTMNRYLSGTANYILLDRLSNFPANKLTKNRWLIGLAAQL